MKDPFDPREYRSVSQLQQYEKCPYSWYLQRVQREWQRPAAWLAQGSAVHEAIEAWERSGRTMSIEEMQEVFRDSYRKHIDESCEETPNLEWWFPSGQYRGAVDIERRWQLGLDQVPRYPLWASKHPEEVIWIAPDGTPGIELDFDIDLDGILIRGYIDAVLEITDKAITDYQGAGKAWSDRSGKDPRTIPWLRVRDHKTGKQPGSDLQLAVYAIALAEMYEMFGPYEGDFWMAQSGKATYPFDLTDWSRDRVAERFHALEENIQAGRFPPDPEPGKCRFCSVSHACKYAAR